MGGGGGRMLASFEVCLSCRRLLLMPCAGLTAAVNTVDIFNATSGIWTTAALSAARYYLAATSLPNDGLAIFAGGKGAQHVLKSLIVGGRVCWVGANLLANCEVFFCCRR